MIVIIDSSFPLGKEEVFLDGELREICNMSEDIIIFPIFASNNQIYSVPENVTINTCCSTDRTIGTKFLAVLRTMTDKDFWDDFIYTIKKNVSFKRVLAPLYYAILINEKYYLISKTLKKNKLQPRLFYSYWMHTHACIGAKLKNRFDKCRFITRCHGYDLYEFRSSIGYLPGRRLIFSTADDVISVSRAGADYLINRYSLENSGLISVSYLGTFDYGHNQWDSNEFRIVSCSNLVAVKRVHIIIEALSQIKEEKIHWIHYGDGELMDPLRTLAKEKLANNISYEFRGFTQHEKLMEEYKKYSISVFLNVSESEGLPVSIMEAMSFGIPAIATNVGGTNEIVKDQYNGVLLDAETNPEDLSRIIIDFYLKDKEEQEQMRKNARFTWEEKFNAKRNYIEFRNKYLS